MAGQDLGRRILVVDDNIQIHGDFEKILRRPEGDRQLDELEAELLGVAPARHSNPGFDLAFVHRGEDAVPLLQQGLADGAPFALAFVDIRMPAGWDGIQTAVELWKTDRRLQIVFCTAYSDYSLAEMTSKLESRDDFLVLKKPFDPIEVRQLARSLTEKWALLRERERYTRSLEHEVRARTAELAEANEQLRAEMQSRIVAEHAARRATKLEALGRMSAGICHEINNPLTFVVFNLGAARDLITDIGKEDPRVAEIDEMIADAATGAERIRKIVLHMRTFSHPHADALGEVAVLEVVESARRMLEGELRNVGGFFVDVDPDLRVHADAGGLEQVLVNLLVNASHALGKREAASNEIHVRASVALHEVSIEVQDNGVGITEKDLDSVFDPFFTTKPVGQGTGLGLSTSRGIVESFGGRLELRSKKGVGTSAFLHLRRARAVVDAAPPQSRSTTAH